MTYNYEDGEESFVFPETVKLNVSGRGNIL